MKTIKNGFTLIELLVVVLIIGILAAVAVPQYRFTVTTSRLKSGLPLAYNLLHSQERFFVEHGKYATDLSQLDITSNCDSVGYRCYTGNGMLQSSGERAGIVGLKGVPSIYVFYASKNVECLASGSDTTNFENRVCQKATGDTTASPIFGANYYSF